ncbi:MAG: hypothetical protein A3I63_07740 [Betaproteobacteria bacterium RIFCSPLOWO2_02_FULL_66_14]|nr:MAG: hypothetical protein A3I63_07740 [Betaproteobacteria bacterium RIFCSPLOWO2_02_FULL_66_14]
MALAAEGVRLAVTARRRQRLDELASEIEGAGALRPIVIEQDLMSSDAAQRIAEQAIAAFGKIEILVNNAGGSRAFKLHASEEHWEEALTLKFTRHRQLTDRLLDPMVANRRGRIIDITGAVIPVHGGLRRYQF